MKNICIFFVKGLDKYKNMCYHILNLLKNYVNYERYDNYEL